MAPDVYGASLAGECRIAFALKFSSSASTVLTIAEIEASDRIAGEWEPKQLDDDTERPHGFEYRSLPGSVDKLKAARTALKILKSCSTS